MNKKIKGVGGSDITELTKKELTILKKVLDAFEDTFDTDTKVVADMSDYDDQYICIRATDEDNEEMFFKMRRENLLSKTSIDEKVDSIS